MVLQLHDSENLSVRRNTPNTPPTPTWARCLVAAGVPTVLTAVHAAYYGQWIVDDAGLTFASARSLATGAGPVLQPGAEPVEGYSNPVWVVVLVVGRWLGLFDHGAWFGVPDLVLFPKFVALLCCFGIFAAMFSIASTITRHPVPATIVAGAVTSAVPSFVIWTTSGLENALFALEVMAIAAVLARAAANRRLLAQETAIIVGCLAALAALTRPDGVIYVAAFPLAAALLARKDTIRPAVRASVTSVITFMVPVLIYIGWRLMTFGDFLPNPARAKEQGFPTLADLNKPAALVSYVGWLTVCLGAAAVAVAVWRASPARTVVVMVLIPLGLAVLSYTVLRSDWMAQYRFATPVWPLAAIVVTVSAGHVLRDASTRMRVIALALATVGAVSTLNGFLLSAREFRAEPTVAVCHIAQNTGYAFNGYADILRLLDGSLLAVDGGGTSLTSRLRYIDLSGLGDRRIARFWQADDMAGLRDYIFDEVRPTFLKIYWRWAERKRLRLAEDPRLARDYVLMYSGRPGGGEWVRRDAVPNESALVTAGRWGQHFWDLASERYGGVRPEAWWCGDTLRPTPYSDGVPAPSPVTAKWPPP